MKRFYPILLLAPIFFSFPVLAQTPTPPNPLETPVQNPIVPLNRPLTPEERQKLTESLDKLDAEARAKYDAGLYQEAFPIWYEEIKQRRALGDVEEVKGLGRVGLAAWERDRTDEVKYINQRLKNIQQNAETGKKMTPELRAELGIAYEQIRAIDSAVTIYDRILADARKANDPVAIEANLSKLGELHLKRFDYQRAAPVYEELLVIARSRNDSLQEGIYLQKLAEIYHESLQPANAARIKEEIAENYLRNQQPQLIPPMKILIGLDYQALNDPNKASQNFQEAYSLAFALQQYGTAGEALGRLAELYQKYGQTDYALQIYQETIKVHELGYNYYGLMTTYDKIGQIYLDRKDYRQAMNAFQKGSELARAIRYREEYFQNQIARVNQAMTQPPTEEKPAPSP
ncbi:tetratricopeptide repeat protein [Pannus brasiliensis CCIBt3594]|uniref:Tetratricopeptide repeat protein n=1 Tax=Pannus brasiliensis CCIBt3594 TaxID=1427578 RepID=A0AAW9QKV0_9CHRO